MAVPLVNLVTLIWFATAHWPLEMGYVGQGDNARVDVAWELKMALRKAIALEKRGQLDAAARQFDLVAERAGAGHPMAATARERAEQLRTRLPGGAAP